MGEILGLGDIFKKENKLLDPPQELPELASEKLDDEKAFNEPVPVPEKKQETLNNYSVNTPEKPVTTQNQPSSTMHSSQMPPQNFSYPQMPVQHPMPIMQPMYYQYPMHYPQQFVPQYPAPHHFEKIPREEIKRSHRTPLRNLLSELDMMEERWHSLTAQKNSMEKELKYLEAEIEHKLKLLRSHMVIANEETEVALGKEFLTADGKVLKSRKDLEVAASEMSQQVFDHHVGPGWNDFSVWAKNCLKDVELAQRLKTVRNPVELVAALKKY